MAEDIQHTTYQYLDLDIQIGKGDGTQYPVSVHSQGGDAHENIAFPFDINELDRYLDKLQIALLRSAQVHRQLSDEELKVREFGEKLFQALFFQDIRSCYDRSLALAQSKGKGLRIRLNIEADELAGLPWEFLFDPDKDDYLCLSAHTPVVRYLDAGQIILPMEVELPLQVLGMVASPVDLDPLEVSQEKANLEKALAPLIQEGRAKLTWLEDGSWRALLDALNAGPWHIFHFVGHGGYDDEAKEGIVAFEGTNKRAQYINAGQLARLLGEHSYLRVVILNSCESAQSGKEDVFSSTAATLLKRGVPAVIAMQYSISDPAAIELSQTFYKCLAAGLPVDAAISRARLALSFAIRNTLEWGTPVLLMRTEDGVLFNLKPSKEPALQAERVEKADVAGALVLQSSARQAIEGKDWQLAEQQIEALNAYGRDGQDMVAVLRRHLDDARKTQAEDIDKAQQEVNSAVNTYEWALAEKQLDRLKDEGAQGQAAAVELGAQISAAKRKQASLIFGAQKRADLVIKARNWQAVETVITEMNGLGKEGRVAADKLRQTLEQALQVRVTAPAKPAVSSPKGIPWKWIGGGALVIVILVALFGLAGLAISNYVRNTNATKTARAVASQAAPVVVVVPTGTTAPTSELAPPTESPPAATETPTATESPTPEPTHTSLPIPMLLIPAGSFQMGEDPDRVLAACLTSRGEGKCNRNWFADEEPAHEVNLDAFYIDAYEVTNSLFATFLYESGNQIEDGAPWFDDGDPGAQIHLVSGFWQVDEGYGDLPVVEVTWYGAQAFCDWRNGRLPTEAEWEKAARGGLEGKLYPWGDETPVCTSTAFNGAQTMDCVPSDTISVGSFTRNGYGLYDMAGNVWEWVMDWYGGYSTFPEDNPSGPDVGDSRVLRGGSFSNFRELASVAMRMIYNPSDSARNFGFRCVRSP